ncbi:hypothetical protein AB0D67_31650 [Streptosporangium sp. NPDC048047]|uniref:hypothetical protein n=1 Tax=Streptosporangium sp. NPDC048047 TaxID=3155748 RepID=UPI00341A51C8
MTRTMTAVVLSGFVEMSEFTGKTVGKRAPGRIGAGVERFDLHPWVECRRIAVRDPRTGR